LIKGWLDSNPGMVKHQKESDILFVLFPFFLRAGADTRQLLWHFNKIKTLIKTVWGDLFNRPVCGFVHSGKRCV
jgi:hypothetical protein